MKYLTSKPFRARLSLAEIQDSASLGFYGFSDYAMAHWGDHLVHAFTESPSQSLPDGLLSQLREYAMRMLLEYGEDPLQTRLAAESGQQDGIDLAKCLPADPIQRGALFRFGDRARAIRAVITDMLTSSESPAMNAFLRTAYGPFMHKCNRPWCRAFYTGFPNEKSLALHVSQHERPFKCQHVSCPSYSLGFAARQLLEKHMKRVHRQDNEIDFPTDAMGTKTDDLCSATVRGDFEAVKRHVMSGAKINCTSRPAGGETPLIIATKRSDYRIAKYLLESGADINFQARRGCRRTALHTAIEQNDLDMVQLFLGQDGVNLDLTVDQAVNGLTGCPWPDCSALSYSASLGFKEVTEALLQLADPNRPNRDGLLPIHAACTAKDCVGVVRLLLTTTPASNLDRADAGGRTPLAWAAVKGCFDAFRLLLATEAVDVDAVDKTGESVLSKAVRGRNQDIVKLLLPRVRFIDSRDNVGATPLSYAVRNGTESFNMVSLLLDTDVCEIDSVDNEGRSVLSHAASSGGIESVNALLELGAKTVNTPDEDGWTPLHYAMHLQRKDVVEVLAADHALDANALTHRAKFNIPSNSSALGVGLYVKDYDLCMVLVGSGRIDYGSLGSETVARVLADSDVALEASTLVLEMIHHGFRPPLIQALKYGADMGRALLIQAGENLGLRELGHYERAQLLKVILETNDNELLLLAVDAGLRAPGPRFIKLQGLLLDATVNDMPGWGNPEDLTLDSTSLHPFSVEEPVDCVEITDMTFAAAHLAATCSLEMTPTTVRSVCSESSQSDLSDSPVKAKIDTIATANEKVPRVHGEEPSNENIEPSSPDRFGLGGASSEACYVPGSSHDHNATRSMAGAFARYKGAPSHEEPCVVEDHSFRSWESGASSSQSPESAVSLIADGDVSPALESVVDSLLRRWRAWKTATEGSHSENCNDSSLAPLKRRAAHANTPSKRQKAGEGGAHEQEGPSVVSTSTSSGSSSTYLFACPYWKRDATKHKVCIQRRLAQISYVKQHLNRDHHPKPYCSRCWRVFSEEGERDDHNRESSCTMQDRIEFDWLSIDKQRELKRRIPKGTAPEHAWFLMWDIVFPGEMRPLSPYIPEGLSDDLCSFYEYLRTQGTQDLRSGLVDSGGLVLDGEAIEQLLQLGIQRVFEDWFHQPRGPNHQMVSPVSRARGENYSPFTRAPASQDRLETRNTTTSEYQILPRQTLQVHTDGSEPRQSAPVPGNPVMPSDNLDHPTATFDGTVPSAAQLVFDTNADAYHRQSPRSPQLRFGPRPLALESSS